MSKSKTHQIRLTSEQHERWEREAKAAGVTVSEYIRRAVDESCMAKAASGDQMVQVSIPRYIAEIFARTNCDTSPLVIACKRGLAESS